MKEYIERTTILNLLGKINPVDFGSMFDYEAHSAVQECLREISYGVENISAADVAEVRHGRWIPEICESISKRNRLIEYKVYSCSLCGRSNGRIKKKYCPNCGALMKEDEHEAR